MAENINKLLRDFEKLRETDDIEKTKAVSGKIIAYYKRTGLDGSENFGRHLYNMCVYYINLGSYREALKYGRAALDVFRNNGSRLCASLYGNLGIIYGELGDKASALSWIKKCYNIKADFRNAEKFSSYEVFGAALNLGSAYYENGIYDKALKYHLSALKLLEEQDDEYANCLNLAAYDFEQLGKYDFAAEYLKDALDIYEECFGREETDYIANKSYYASVLKKGGRLSEAISEYEGVIRLLKEAGCGKEPFYADVLNKTAELYSETGQDKKALDLRFEALEMFENRLGAGSLYYANCLRDIAEIYRRNGIYQKAAAYLGKGLEIKGSVVGLDDKEFFRDYMRLEELYEEMGLGEKAVEILEYLAENLPPSHGEYKRVILKLAKLYVNVDKAGKLYELYVKYKKADPAAGFDDMLGAAGLTGKEL